MPDLVYVIDASSLFNTKRQIKAERQWDFFNDTMTEMVESGELLIVPQVETECGKARHPDVPGTWALAKAKLSPSTRDPSLRTVRIVLAAWPSLIDPQGEAEQADPYVVARALELQDSFQDVCVVADDMTSHLPARASMAEVCDDFEIPWINLADFLGSDHLHIPRNRLTPTARRAPQLNPCDAGTAALPTKQRSHPENQSFHT